MFNWENDDGNSAIPGQIQFFVDATSDYNSENTSFPFGVLAVIKSLKSPTVPLPGSVLLLHGKLCEGYYLVDVDCITGPCIILDNLGSVDQLGNETEEVFQLRPREEWADLF